MALNVYERNCLAWIERIYHQSKSFPALEEIQQEWPSTFPTIQQLEAWLISPPIKAALHNRGLNPTSKANSPLSEIQSAAILIVANLSDRRALSTKLKSIGVTLTQWNAWKKQAAFKNFLHSQLTDDFDTSLDRALAGLLKATDQGNPRAVELYMELTNRQPTENERNYRLAITRLVECVTRHVKDPQILKAISEDFDKIERGIDPSATINLTHWESEPKAPVVIENSYQSSPNSLGDAI